MPRPLAARTGRRPRGALLAIPIAALIAAAGCGNDNANDASALPASVELVASDFAFEELPARIRTDTTLSMRNDSTTEVHELVAFRLPDDLDGTAEEILAMPEDQLGFMDGPPVLVIVAGPGGEPLRPVGDGTLGEPGRYLLFCAIPTGADPDDYLAAAANSEGPPDVPGGPPHFVHGMTATIEVAAP